MSGINYSHYKNLAKGMSESYIRSTFGNPTYIEYQDPYKIFKWEINFEGCEGVTYLIITLKDGAVVDFNTHK
jgi:hypothetical protein